MSWNIAYIGTPEKITEALDKNSENLTGQSKEEYDRALPHLKVLVNENYNATGAPIMKVEASGHATSGSYGYMRCLIEPLNGQLV
jgi:hypothetical protein